MSGELSLRNRQRTRPVNLRLLRHIARRLLTDFMRPKHFALGLHLVDATEMTRLNETFLQHEGSTDVITFDHSASELPIALHSNPLETRNSKLETVLHGEIFISLDDAVSQARQFRTTWQSEVVRYLLHGVLHLRGHDDLHPAARRKMKREENRLLRELSRRFDLSALKRKPK